MNAINEARERLMTLQSETPTDALESRLRAIEIRLGLRQPDPVPESTHATCRDSRLRLPVDLFPERNPAATSLIWSAWNNGTAREQAVMANPRTIGQERFDLHWNPADQTGKGICAELRRFAQNRWGRGAILQGRCF